MSKFIFFVVFIFIFIFPQKSFAENIDEKIDNYLNFYAKRNKFSGSVLISKNSKIILEKSYGFANIEHNVKNNIDTKFRLGSITKQFTAMAIMLLEQKGLLNTNDKISKYIKDFPNSDKITIHNLLTHTSGISNFTNYDNYIKLLRNQTNIEELITRFKDKPLDFEPNTKYNYSNSNYILLSFIIEKVSGQSYEEFIENSIFKPLKMNDSGYDHYEEILLNRAQGYKLNEKDELEHSLFIDMSIPSGAGALYSTVKDLYLWDQALNTNQLLKTELINKMFTPFKSNYAYGWFVFEQNNRKLITHSGGIDGFVTNILRFPKDNICIIVLSNNENAPTGQISDTLSKIIFNEKYDIPKDRMKITISSDILKKYIGRYKLNIKSEIYADISIENDRLYIQLTKQPKIELNPESEKEFFIKEIDAQVSFILENNNVKKLIIHQNGNNVEADLLKN